MSQTQIFLLVLFAVPLAIAALGLVGKLIFKDEIDAD